MVNIANSQIKVKSFELRYSVIWSNFYIEENETSAGIGTAEPISRLWRHFSAVFLAAKFTLFQLRERGRLCSTSRFMTILYIASWATL